MLGRDSTHPTFYSPALRLSKRLSLIGQSRASAFIHYALSMQNTLPTSRPLDSRGLALLERFLSEYMPCSYIYPKDWLRSNKLLAFSADIARSSVDRYSRDV